MSNITDALYSAFQKNLEAVNGSCVRVSKAGLGKAVADIFQGAGVRDACLAETPLLREAADYSTSRTPAIA